MAHLQTGKDVQLPRQRRIRPKCCFVSEPIKALNVPPSSIFVILRALRAAVTTFSVTLIRPSAPCSIAVRAFVATSRPCVACVEPLQALRLQPDRQATLLIEPDLLQPFGHRSRPLVEREQNRPSLFPPIFHIASPPLRNSSRAPSASETNFEVNSSASFSALQSTVV